MKNRFVLPALTATAVVGNLIVIPAASAAEVGAEGASPSEGSRFSIGVLPDTQFYSRYSTRRPATWLKLVTEANPTWPKPNGWWSTKTS